jgi:TonB family protein
LNGRELGSGGLPRPVYNVQEEGRVVVTITVNPAGQVIHTSINKRTNTANAALRKAAEDAARKARFNAVNGVNNQTGTITYYFKLK